MAAILAISCATGAIIYSVTVQLAHTSRLSEDASTVMTEASNLNIFGARQKYFSYDYLLTFRDLDQKGYAKARHDFEDSAKKIETIFNADDPSLVRFVKAYADVHDIWQAKVGDEEFRLGKDPATWEQARSLLKGDLSQQLSDESRATGTALMAAARQWSDQCRQAYAAQLAFLRLVVVLGLVAGVGVAALVTWLINRGVTRPLIVMASAMKKLAEGDQAATVPALDRRDEIGELAAAMQAFKDAAQERVRLESDAVAARHEAERERHSNEETRAETARQLGLVVSSVATGLARLSAGDLVFRLTEPLAPEYEQVRIDFNATVAKLQDTMAVIATTADAIRAGMAEISSASEDLSKRTEQQAAGLEQTAATLDEITATVRTTAQGADQARDAVAAARSDAERSGQVVQNAVAAMAEIEQSSKQISQIIGVIDEIAFQTNLLALNAGVEAARAGDSGKGFAVVASEVRGLAQRSADAAKEIKALISASSRQVGAGVELVGETGKALQRIVTQIGDINAVVVDIAASAKEQATGLHEVNSAVNQMDQVTQQNAAMVEQSTAASHALETETEQLAQLVARFDVGLVAESARPASRVANAARPWRRSA